MDFVITQIIGGLGYALLATTLKINGTSIIKRHRWNVYWDNPVVSEGSKSMTAPTITQDTGDPLKTKLSWSVSFLNPGEYYEFTVDAVNEGDIDAKIAKIDMEVEDRIILPKYIKFTATYDDGTEPKVDDILSKKVNNTPGKQKYKIRVEYDGDYATAETINNMPDEGETINITYIISYYQPNVSLEQTDTTIKTVLANITKNPDNYRNQDQSSINRDIGIDDQGNVINLDWWVDKSYCPGAKDYYLDEEEKEITLGIMNCEEALGMDVGEDHYEYEYPIYTMATASDQIEDGEVTTPIPAYIYLDDEDDIYPVTKIEYIFGDRNGNNQGIEVVPNLPKTIKTIGTCAFDHSPLKKITLPEGIEEIGSYAFANFWDVENQNIKLPRTLKMIREYAFDSTYIDSVTVPRTATIESDAFGYNDPIIRYY